ncbi:hypothetical protein GQ54DRAFT_118020 [Martensiomyces pterosporus]|nr:hypothetical protein GQ54DRAFT_118020 [Martensiomyces pterosporus]
MLALHRMSARAPSSLQREPQGERGGGEQQQSSARDQAHSPCAFVPVAATATRRYPPARNPSMLLVVRVQQPCPTEWVFYLPKTPMDMLHRSHAGATLPLGAGCEHETEHPAYRASASERCTAQFHASPPTQRAEQPSPWATVDQRCPRRLFPSDASHLEGQHALGGRLAHIRAHVCAAHQRLGASASALYIVGDDRRRRGETNHPIASTRLLFCRCHAQEGLPRMAVCVCLQHTANLHVAAAILVLPQHIHAQPVRSYCLKGSAARSRVHARRAASRQTSLFSK